LDEQDKAFVQKYNAKIKHKEPLDNVTVPAGVVINKARRAKSSANNEENKNEDNIIEPPAKKPKTSKKNIRFDVDQNDVNSE
jgi:hypothetical protein